MDTATLVIVEGKLPIAKRIKKKKKRRRTTTEYSSCVEEKAIPPEEV